MKHSQIAYESFSDNLSINAQLFSTCVQLQALLDAIAKVCSHSSDTVEEVNFYSYSFDAMIWGKILFHRKKIQDLRFRGRLFDDIVYSLKHQIPWVGFVSRNAENGVHDIFDENNIGFFSDVLKSIIQSTERMIAIISSDDNIYL